MSAPLLDGIHHIKVPVTNLERSREWYQSRLGYQLVIEFVEQGVLRGLVLQHPQGGPDQALRLNTERSAGMADFDFFAIGVPDRPSIEALAQRLTDLGETHAGLHFASIGWILPGLHDPDGHEVRFYTTEHHSAMDPDHVVRIDDAVATAARREQELTQAT